MFRSTLNHTQALISTSINAVCARTNSSEKYRVTELGYCGTTLLTSGNSVSMMILFTSVVDGRVILSRVESPKSFVDHSRLPHSQFTHPTLLLLSSSSDSLAEASSTTSDRLRLQRERKNEGREKKRKEPHEGEKKEPESTRLPHLHPSLFPNRPPSFLRPTPLKQSVVEPTQKHQQSTHRRLSTAAGHLANLGYCETKVAGGWQHAQKE
ncbi:hypothetical protein BLNAU_20678 [Blattamonas nauphoetae]|uniref:Uncharacterized protein n=1 Tax=Blattamonas nauphoetae TaxID=2049346 RepID=A0ABQ9WY30_9EUKA|nr:hypothetical protein BLNAU_20678 [Blattamonas nauphoetae]